MDHTETLKNMLQDIINDRTSNAEVSLHDYIVAKTREVSGFAQPATTEVDDDSDDE